MPCLDTLYNGLKQMPLGCRNEFWDLF